MTTSKWERLLDIISAAPPFLNLAGSAVACIIGLMLMAAFYRATRLSTGGPREFSLAFLFLSGTYVGRTIYWDVLRHIFSEESWARWADLSGGVAVNIVWSITFGLGCYHGLRGLHLTIPVEDRIRWPWWRAWLYPPFNPRYAFREIATVARANLRLRLRRSK